MHKDNICLVPQFPKATTWVFNTDNDLLQKDDDDDFEVKFSDTKDETIKLKMGYEGKVMSMLLGCYKYLR